MPELASIAPLDIIGARDVPLSLRRVFRGLLGMEVGSLDVTLPDGRSVRFAGTKPGPHAQLAMRSYGFVRRLAAGDVGFADGYIAREWETDDLPALLGLLAANQSLIDRFAANPVLRLVQMARHALNRNSRAGSRRNIHAHYDLGNAFYRAWLDPGMTYSSGLDVEDDLASAQDRKYAAIIAAADIRRQHHILEIGCGWGGFAEYAARFIGCKVTALTISEAQYDYARRRIAEAGLEDRVTVKRCDYRDEAGAYDRIVSIEMFEAVGEAYWQTYFETLQARLTPGGRAALQVITVREDVFPRYRREMDFIRHYIFPGGMLPTQTHLQDLIARHGFVQAGLRAFGPDYAATCRLWRERFEAAWPDMEPLGFDARFRRLWRYYLAYCEAGFMAGTISVLHVAFDKPLGAAA